MRLIQYLNENVALSSFSDYDEVIKILTTRCSDILNVYRKSGGTLYRGQSQNRGSTIDFMEFKSHIKDRRPRDTGQAHHEELNKAFKSYFGWPVRNGVSTTPYVQQAESYGVVSYFFAPNGYKFVYSLKIADLWQELHKFITPVFDQNQKFQSFQWFQRFSDGSEVPIKPEEFMKNYYIDKDLTKAIKHSKGEIMFNVPYYYLLRFTGNQDYAYPILDALKIKTKVKYY